METDCPNANCLNNLELSLTVDRSETAVIVHRPFC